MYAFGTARPRVRRVERLTLVTANCTARTADGSLGTRWGAAGSFGRSATGHHAEPLTEPLTEPPPAVSSEAAHVGEAVAMERTLHLFDSSMPTDDWRRTAVEFVDDSSSFVAEAETHLVTASGEIVMGADEAPYMVRLAEAAVSAGGGRILEIGFGLGISSRALAKVGATVHVVAEPNVAIYNRSLRHARAVSASVAFLPALGFWQELTPWLADGSFDGILYDAFPDAADQAFLREARRLLRPGGVLTFYHSTCDALGHALEVGRECEPWPRVVARLRSAGWQTNEIPPTEPPATVLQIDNACTKPHASSAGISAATLSAGGCGSRPRTFVTPAITRGHDGLGYDGLGHDRLGHDRLGHEGGTVRGREREGRRDDGGQGAGSESAAATAGRSALAAAQLSQHPASDSPAAHSDAAESGATDETRGASLGAVAGKVMGATLARRWEPAAHRGGSAYARLLQVGWGTGSALRAIEAVGGGVAIHAVVVEANIEAMSLLVSLAAGEGVGEGNSDGVGEGNSKGVGKGVASVRPLLGCWQDVIPLLANGSFDAILFDASAAPRVGHARLAPHAARLLAPRGVFVVYGAHGDDAAGERAAALAVGLVLDDATLDDTALEDATLELARSQPFARLTRLGKPDSSSGSTPSVKPYSSGSTPSSSASSARAPAGLRAARMAEHANERGLDEAEGTTAALLAALLVTLLIVGLSEGCLPHLVGLGRVARAARATEQPPSKPPGLSLKAAPRQQDGAFALGEDLPAPCAPHLPLFAVFKVAVGAVLACDALDRGLLEPDDAELLHTRVGATAFRGLLAAQAVIAAGLCSLGALRSSQHGLSSALGGAGFAVALAIEHAEPRAFYVADLLLRWLLVWLLALPCTRACAGLVLQTALVYGSSLLWKSTSAYVVEGHALRSMLLTESAAMPDAAVWQRAIRLAFSPLGPWLSRAAWSMELTAALAGSAAGLTALLRNAGLLTRPPSRRHLLVLRAVVDAAVALHLAIFLMCRLHLFPLTACAMHAGAHEAMGALLAAAPPPACQSVVGHSWRERLASALVAIALLQLLIEQSLPSALFEAHYRPRARAIGLSQVWDMFKLDDADSLTTGRTVTFVSGHGFEANLLTLAPRSSHWANAPARDFGVCAAPQRPVRAVRRSSRWVYYELRNSRGARWTAREQSFEGRAACASASALWRAGRLPGPPHSIEQYLVVYDLPRLSNVTWLGQHQWLLDGNGSVPVHITSTDPTAWGFDPTTATWGAWPRTVVAFSTFGWDCAAHAAIEEPPVFYTFVEGSGLQDDANGEAARTRRHSSRG